MWTSSWGRSGGEETASDKGDDPREECEGAIVIAPEEGKGEGYQLVAGKVGDGLWGGGAAPRGRGVSLKLMKESSRRKR